VKRLFGHIDLTKGNVAKNLALFALPFFISYFLNSLYSAIDLMFIGQFSDTFNIAAVSSGTTIMFAVNSVIAGLATGGTIVIGQYFGAQNKNIRTVTKNLILYMIIVAVAVLVIMFALFYPIATWMQLDEGALLISRMYLFILILGIPFYVGYTTISAILRGLGNSFVPFVFFGIAVITNIGLDALFVIVFKWGALGAALATVIGQVVGFIVSLIYLFIFKLPYKVKMDFKFDRNIIGEIIKCGFPIAIQDGLVIISFAVILAAVSVRGVDYTAAVGITDRVTSFGFVPLSAIGSAVSTATAQNMGANNTNNVKKYMYFGLLYGVIVGGLFGLACQLFPRQLATIFAGSNTEALEIAVPYIQSTSLDIFVCAFVFPINAVFIGSGHTVFAMSQNLGVTFFIRMPMALLLALVINSSMYVVGLAYATSTVFSLIACVIFYLSKKWMNLKSLSLKIEEEKLE
jgi:putative MATE family efflux protein